MSPRKLFRFLTALFICAVLLAACSPTSLENKPVDIIATPVGNIELVEVFATHNPTLLSSGTPIPNIFPSGLDKIYLGIKFKKFGMDETRLKLDYDLTYKGVELDTEFDGLPASWKEQTSASEVVILPIRKVDRSTFSDGPYQAKLSIDGELIALLNFTIGSSPTP